MAMQSIANLQVVNRNTVSLTPVTVGAMPLAMVAPGEEVKVVSIKGRDNTRRFLENLGFVEGAVVSIVTELAGNVIVSIKESRIAVNKGMAIRILTVKA
ncbi:Fe2+ transport system protein A [Desulfitobacterium dichloroeliminans LMG P-21439]|uniref:Fe2+ transport system protein A n=2 Tax=Desulfitobacterium dichloroeliminans TaxID=233055 RepID=L0F9W8_DESDL|nr:Fe2+ transport system protein A [Desulfitobacterium dichloroeliminans LMG P-21439]